MRQFILIITALLIGVLVADAQTIKGVNVESFTMERAESFVIVDMEIDISELNVRGSKAVILTPHIVRDTMSVALKSIGIYSRNRDIYYQRNADLSPTTRNDFTFRNSKAPEKVSYRATVNFEEWMDGCQLVFERTDYCCNNLTLGTEGDVLVERFPKEPYKPTLIYIEPEAEAVKIRELSGSAFIDFPVNKMDIQPSYRNNESELAKIIGTIDSVKENSDITITSIILKGYASPESSYKNNTRLADGRTEALKSYIESLYSFDDDIITTSFEPEDWAGLERYVEESQLTNKDAILAIIRTDEDPDVKEWRIKSQYPADYHELLTDCYPTLRHSDYIISYTLRHYSDPAEIEQVMNTAPQQLSLEEFYILAQTYEAGNPAMDELWEIAVRMYPNDEIANFNAANSAMNKRDFERALRYLSKAGDRAEVDYSRGCIEVLREDYSASIPHLESAKSKGIEAATPVLEAANSHWKVSQKR